MSGKANILDNDSAQPTQAGKIVVGKNPHKVRKLILWAFAGLIVILGLGASWFFFIRDDSKPNNDVAFTVNGQAYTKQQISDLISYPVQFGISKDDAAKQAFEMYKRSAAAESSGVKLNDEMTKAAQKQLYPNADEATLNNAWVKLVINDQALQNMSLGSSYYSDAAGDVYIFYFGQRIDYNTTNPVEGFGNETLIQQDRDYAKQRAEYYHDALANNKMSDSQVLVAVKADKKLSYGDANSSNPSLHFDLVDGTNTTDSPLANIDSKIVQLIITKGSAKGITDMAVGSVVLDGLNPLSTAETPESRETYFYFVSIEKPATYSFSVAAYTQALNDVKVSYVGL